MMIELRRRSAPGRERPRWDWTDLASGLSRFYERLGFVLLWIFYIALALVSAALLTWATVQILERLPVIWHAFWRLVAFLWSVPWIYKALAPFALFFVLSQFWIDSMKPKSEDAPIRGRHVLSGTDARKQASRLTNRSTSANSHKRS